jgi:hypothetical protein
VAIHLAFHQLEFGILISGMGSTEWRINLRSEATARQSEVVGFIRAAPERTLGLEQGARLVSRLGPEYASRRARLELAEEAKGARRETNAHRSFWALLDKYIARLLKAAGRLHRGQANAARIQVTRNFAALCSSRH